MAAPSSSVHTLEPPRPKSVLVIGGGAAGLVTLRNLLQHGPNDALPPFERVQLIERRADIGGVWHLDTQTLALEQSHKHHHADGIWPITQDPTTSQPTQRPHWPSPAYPQLRGNVLPPFLSFSDFPPFPAPAHGEPFPTLSETHAYLRAFADRAELGANRKAGLWPYIRLSTELRGVVQLPPHAETGQPGGWAVRIAEWGQGKQGEEHTEHWDAVVLATAWYDNPVYPRTPGIDVVRAAGKLVHAKWYRSPLPYRGKRVVIVGNGNSSNDIAAHLAALKPLPGPGVNGIDAEPIYRSIKHPALPNFVSLPDERIRDVAFIEKYTVRHDDEGDAVDVHLNDGTTIKDVDLVILGVGYGYGYGYAHLLKEGAAHELADIPNPLTHSTRFHSWDPLAYVHSHPHHFESATEDEEATQLPPPVTHSEGTAEEIASETQAEASLSDAERAEPIPRIKHTFLHLLSTHRGGNNGTLAFVGLATVFWPFVVADFASRALRTLWDGSAPAEVEISDRDETLHSNDPERTKGTDLSDRARAPLTVLRLNGSTQLSREAEERARVRDLQKKRALLRQVEAQRRLDAAAALLARRGAETKEEDKALFQTAPDLMTKYHCPGNEEIKYIHTLRTIVLASRPDLELDRGTVEVPADALSWNSASGGAGAGEGDVLWAGGAREVPGRGAGLLRADDEALRRRNASPQIKLGTLWAARRRLEASGLYGKGLGAGDVEGVNLDLAGGRESVPSLETVPLRKEAEAERRAAIEHQQGGVEGALPAALAGLHISSSETKPIKAEWKLDLSSVAPPGQQAATTALPRAEGSLEVVGGAGAGADSNATDAQGAKTPLSSTLATLEKAREVLNSTLTGWIGAIGKEDGEAPVVGNGSANVATATRKGGKGQSGKGAAVAGDDEVDEDEEEEEEDDGGDDGNVHARPPAAASAVATAAS
ncbi:hypothetical protein V8E36_007414 [Tilletia maclaganii]